MYKKTNNLRKTNINKISKVKGYRNLWYQNWFYYFTLSNYSNLFIFFFLHLKKLILYVYINNSFSFFNNRILIYNYKNNFLFLRNSFFQFDYLIKGFLDMEIDEIMK